MRILQFPHRVKGDWRSSGALHATVARLGLGEMMRSGTAGVDGNFQPLPDPAQLEKRDGRGFAVGFWRQIVSPCVSLDFAPDQYISHG